MDILRKIFTRTHISWSFLLIFSVVVGVLVGILNRLPFLQGTSFTDIAVVLDMWIVLAIFIIGNSTSRKDAILKTFVFFLISQPLIYFTEALYEAIFSGVDLFTRTWFYLDQYYFHGGYWFIWTLLTIPGSALAFEIKKDNIFSSLVLSVATCALAFFGSTGLAGVIIKSELNHLLNSLICLFFAFIFAFIFFKNKKSRIITLSLTSLALVAGVAYSLYYSSQRVPYCSELEGYDPDSSIIVESCIEE